MNAKVSEFSVAYAVSRGWLPKDNVPTQQELVKAIRDLFNVLPWGTMDIPGVADAIHRLDALANRVPS